MYKVPKWDGLGWGHNPVVTPLFAVLAVTKIIVTRRARVPVGSAWFNDLFPGSVGYICA